MAIHVHIMYCISVQHAIVVINVSVYFKPSATNCRSSFSNQLSFQPVPINPSGIISPIIPCPTPPSPPPILSSFPSIISTPLSTSPPPLPPPITQLPPITEPPLIIQPLPITQPPPSVSLNKSSSQSIQVLLDPDEVIEKYPKLRNISHIG